MEKKSNGFASVLVIVVTLVITAVAFIIIKNNQPYNSSLQVNFQQNKPISGGLDSSSSNTSSSDNTKTFRSTEYNFSVKYPENWDYLNSSHTFLMLDFYPSDEGPPDHGGATRVTLTAIEGKDSFPSLREWTDVVDYVEIDGVQAELRKHKENGSKYIFFSKGDIFYEINPHILDFDPDTPDNPQIEKVFNMLISSFEFTN